MAKYNKGDEISFVGKKSGNTILCIVDGVATNGDVWVHLKDDESRQVQLKPAEVTLIKAAPVAPKAAQQGFRYVCLECGQKHNGHACPRCGSDEKIGNTDSDVDMSELLGGSRAERYAPGE